MQPLLNHSHQIIYSKSYFNGKKKSFFIYMTTFLKQSRQSRTSTKIVNWEMNKIWIYTWNVDKICIILDKLTWVIFWVGWSKFDKICKCSNNKFVGIQEGDGYLLLFFVFLFLFLFLFFNLFIYLFIFLLEYWTFINHQKSCKIHLANMRPQSDWEFPPTIPQSHSLVLQIGLKCELAYYHLV